MKKKQEEEERKHCLFQHYN